MTLPSSISVTWEATSRKLFSPILNEGGGVVLKLKEVLSSILHVTEESTTYKLALWHTRHTSHTLTEFLDAISGSYCSLERQSIAHQTKTGLMRAKSLTYTTHNKAIGQSIEDKCLAVPLWKWVNKSQSHQDVYFQNSTQGDWMKYWTAAALEFAVELGKQTPILYSCFDTDPKQHTNSNIKHTLPTCCTSHAWERKKCYILWSLDWQSPGNRRELTANKLSISHAASCK